MIRVIATAIVATIATIPMGMIQFHSTFLEALGAGLSIGFLILISPFIGGGR